ncbi:phage virion morphogenesis protein [Glaesserella parasuis]|uniref:Mu-like prophage FluMu G protein 2 n=2 Tax=Glaesserella parasuis TaxID=738 RepID=A0A837AEY0_GLAPU|nr:phage virion morphogenesis protein [Glaesserella parasuis]EQA07874.1 phage virion morphogenesis protein [Glaesserella parasuis 84-15995]KDB46242.1 Mu-like prophage FluMu G protein 2 [Glaesserella parasuis HPS10]MCT8764964.1 phage virion morphogenesis protein [Glaesserella parasuis]MCT8768393.1 phage virion morphogenesis protein [Glaesserella parasuis]MDD2157528.1 phage virion morphogenesis protein [Glaesserella parasuis]
MLELKINNSDKILAILSEMAKVTRHREPLMRDIAGTMRKAVLDNFEAGGRPSWAGIHHRSGIPLNDSGNLKGSIQQVSDNDKAIVGTNEAYAAIHQFGGVITPKKGKYLVFKIGDRWVMTDKVEIPARPFLMLTPQDDEDILQDVQDYWQSILK